MVPKLFRSGKSFKTLGAYLLHDADKASTSDRVRWTHTLNLASDQPSLAIDEMLWTYRSAEDLKREAGGKTGGRPLKDPVRHFSLNWHVSENPTREHMIETVEAFLKHMGWEDHQAVIVCHADKHPHVHVMLNAVHPETGRALNSTFERRRAQEWAKQYERDHEAVFCEERLKPVEERDQSPNRKIWERMKGTEYDFDRSEVERVASDFDYFTRGDETEGNAKEWQALKQHQRHQREHFFIDGKQAYRAVRNAVFREVREEFRAEWREYYRAVREGVHPKTLAILKEDILQRRDHALDERRTEACRELREQRDEDYAGLLANQKDERAKLREWQSDGQRSYWLLDSFHPAPSMPADDPAEATKTRHKDDLTDEFRESAREVFERRVDEKEDEGVREPLEEQSSLHEPSNPGRMKGIGDVGLGIAGALGAIGESLFDGFFGGGEKKVKENQGNRSEPEPKKGHDARRGAEEQTKTEAAAVEETKLLAYWRERRERKRERD